MRELLCIIYLGFKWIEKGTEIGVDLGKGWKAVERRLADLNLLLAELSTIL